MDGQGKVNKFAYMYHLYARHIYVDKDSNRLEQSIENIVVLLKILIA